MESKINVAVTGYFGTGSSAVVDLLKEYENVRVVPFENQSYEHNVLYHHGGLYDVCTLLSRGNTLYTSDKVILRKEVNGKRHGSKRLKDNSMSCCACVSHQLTSSQSYLRTYDIRFSSCIFDELNQQLKAKRAFQMFDIVKSP